MIPRPSKIHHNSRNSTTTSTSDPSNLGGQSIVPDPLHEAAALNKDARSSRNTRLGTWVHSAQWYVNKMRFCSRFCVFMRAFRYETLEKIYRSESSSH
jgi:hypothetical protein